MIFISVYFFKLWKVKLDQKINERNGSIVEI
jgi:hypothetical protein